MDFEAQAESLVHQREGLAPVGLRVGNKTGNKKNKNRGLLPFKPL